MKIVLDAGHGGQDSGAVGITGVYEKNIVLDYTWYIKEKLEKAGVSVILTRSKDVFVDLSERARIANREKADAFVSIHCNSAADKTARGFEIFHYNNSSKGKELAIALHKEITKNRENYSKDRGIKLANFFVLRETKIPAVLIELGFISNSYDTDIINVFKKSICNSIVNGILVYLGVSVEEKKEKEVTDVKIYKTLEEVPEWAKSTIQKLLEKNALQGDNTGNINITEDFCRTFVVLDRMDKLN